MIREDLTELYFMSQRDIPALLDDIEELNEEINNFDEEDIDLFAEETDEENSDRDITDEDKKNILDKYEELKRFRENPEINNLSVYIQKFENEIDKIKLNEKRLDEDKVQSYINLIEKKINDLNQVYSLSLIIDKGNYGKFKANKLDKFRKQTTEKLENSKYEFYDLSVIEDAIYKVLLEKADIILMKLYMYISMCKKEEMLYVYFVLIAIMSITNEKMINRNTMIDSLNKLYEI